MKENTISLEKMDPLYAKVILDILSASPSDIEKLKDFIKKM